MNTQLPLVLAIIVSSHGWYRVPALHLARALFRREWLKGSVPIAPAFGSRTPLTNFWPGLSLWSATISSFYSCTTWRPAQDSKFRMCVYIRASYAHSVCVSVCLTGRISVPQRHLPVIVGLGSVPGFGQLVQLGSAWFDWSAA